MKAINEAEDFFDKIDNENTRKAVYDLASLILSLDSKFCAAVKWKKLTFALNEDFHHWVCAIGCTKKGVMLYFHYGVLLDDTYNCLVAGENYFLRKKEICYGKMEEEKVIKEYVNQAIDKYDYFKNNWKVINDSCKAGKNTPY